MYFDLLDESVPFGTRSSIAEKNNLAAIMHQHGGKCRPIDTNFDTSSNQKPPGETHLDLTLHRYYRSGCRIRCDEPDRSPALCLPVRAFVSIWRRNITASAGEHSYCRCPRRNSMDGSYHRYYECYIHLTVPLRGLFLDT